MCQISLSNDLQYELCSPLQIYLFLFVSMCLFPMYGGSHRGQREASGLSELELQTVVSQQR